MATTGGPTPSNRPSGGPLPSRGPGSVQDQDVKKDGLLAIAPRNAEGHPTLGGIPLFKKLGQGGMGAVYLGKHPRLGLEVAVKVLPFHLADQDPHAIEYFMREAQSMARLNHPNLVRVYDVNVDGDPSAGSAIWFIVIEYVQGKTAGGYIRERIKNGTGPLNEFEALELMSAITDGLAAAHEEGFVHRDIKPDNIIIPCDPNGVPMLKKAKLMDLGLAKPHSEEGMGLTGTNIAMGTPGYMAPEQAESAKSVTPAADIFSMGGTLYTLLTGAAPFSGTTVLTVLKKTTEEPHIPLKSLNGKVSDPTAVMVDTCLSKRAGDRYANAAILKDALKACIDSLQGDQTEQLTLMSLKNLKLMQPKEPGPVPSSDIMTMKATPQRIDKSGGIKGGTSATTGRKSMSTMLIAFVAVLLIGGLIAFVAFRTPGVEVLRTQAQAAEKAGQTDKAIELYEKLLKEKSDDVQAKSALDTLRGREFEKHFSQGRNQEALEKWEDAEAGYVKAQLVKDTPEVTAALRRVRERKTGDAQFTQKMKDADAAFQKEDYASAERLYGEANQLKASELAKQGMTRSKNLGLEAREIDAVLREVVAKMGEKNYDVAWEKVQAGITKYSKSYDLRLKSAEIAVEHGFPPRLGSAIEDAKQAERLAPTDPKKAAATALRTKLEEKKKGVDATDGVLRDIEQAISDGDFDKANDLLAKADPKHRDDFARQIEKGRKWKDAMDRGAQAEQKPDWPVALAAYTEALGHLSNDKTTEAVKRAEGELRKSYDAMCASAQAHLDNKKYSDARTQVEAAERYWPDGPRHKELGTEIRFRELLAQAIRMRDGGNSVEALKSVLEALKIRKDSAEALKLHEELKASGTLQSAVEALNRGDRNAAVTFAREAAAANPAAKELVELEKALWPELLAMQKSVKTESLADELLLNTKNGQVYGVGAGFGIWKDNLDDVKKTPIAGGRLFGPLITERGKLIGVSGKPDDSHPMYAAVSWDETGQHPFEMKFGDTTMGVMASRLAPFGNSALKIVWTAGGTKEGPDKYTICQIDADKGNEIGRDRETIPAQCHLYAVTAPGQTIFATGGGVYRTYKAKNQVDETKTDDHVYLWDSGLRKRPVRLNEGVGADPIMIFNSDGTKLLVGTAAKKVHIIDVAVGGVVHEFTLPDKPESISASAERNLAAVSAGGKVWFLDLNKFAWQSAPATFDSVRQVLFAKEGKGIFVTCDDGTLRRFVAESLKK